MGDGKRLPAKKRKRQICEAAKKAFLKNGFDNTTMEEVVALSGMSKGGVYHYYSNTRDILYDLMIIANESNINKIYNFLDMHKDLAKEEIITEITLQKMLSENDFKPIYVMFLQKVKQDKKFQKLFNKIFYKTNEEFLEMAKITGLDDLKYLANEGFLAFLQSIIFSCELINVRNIFLKHKDMLRLFIKSYIEKQKANC